MGELYNFKIPDDDVEYINNYINNKAQIVNDLGSGIIKDKNFEEKYYLHRWRIVIKNPVLKNIFLNDNVLLEFVLKIENKESFEINDIQNLIKFVEK